jgi:diadenosine tetraphosphate (Ap4A) HIT family hydrolase
MLNIYETENFIIETRNPPHNSRLDGGHLVISPKNTMKDRTEMTSMQAKEFIKLSMIAGEAMVAGLARQGIELGRINYQDNGNFNITFHLHLYGRAKNAPTQPFGTTFITPRTQEDCRNYFKTLEPLNEEDINAIKEEFEKLLNTDKYKNF